MSSQKETAAQAERPRSFIFPKLLKTYGRLRMTGRSPIQQHMQQHMAMAMEARTGLVLKLCTRWYILIAQVSGVNKFRRTRRT